MVNTADQKRFEEIMNQLRETGEARFSWIKKTDIDLNKQQMEFAMQSSGSAEDVAKQVSEKTELKVEDKDKREEQDSKLSPDQKNFDLNKDGKLDASEDEKYKEDQKKKEEAAKKEAQAVGAVVLAAIGVGVAKQGLANNSTLPFNISADPLGRNNA